MALLRRKRAHQDKRLLIIGLDCADPELTFERFAEEMPHLTALRRGGAFGLLESVIPPITVPAWACMMTGKDPGSLGIYGFRNRTDHSYEGLSIVSSRDVREKAVWDHLSEAGRRCVVVGVPPAYPVKPLNGWAVSCFLTPNAQSEFTYPEALKSEIQKLVGDYLFDVRQFRTEDKAWLLEQVFRLTEQRFRVARHLLTSKPWDFFVFVDMGPDRLHHGFWKYCDPQHLQYEPGNPFEGVMRDYYRFLDEQIGRLLEVVEDGTQILVVSDHGAKRLDGGICVNEWLIREGYLRLKRPPEGVKRFEELEVDWPNTVAWGEGGYYSRVFLNVQGREPQGTIPPGEYESVRDELIRGLEALGDEHGRPIGTRVYRPEEIYQEVQGVAPDLIAILGDLHWRSVGTVGWNTVWVHENDTGPDDANHAQHGLLIASGIAGLKGELGGLKLTAVAGAVLKLCGLPVPAAETPIGFE